MTDALETVRILCSYRHDALDRLAVVDPGAQDSVLRFYQKSRLTVEIQGAVRRRIFQSGDHLLAEHSTEGSTARVDMLGTDVQRSVLHAVTAQECQSLVYSPYGHRLQGTQVPGFNGERADPVTGHYLLGNGYRAFNPVLMRFNNPDTLSPFGRGGLNAYAYCLGDPVNRIDPSGHISGFRRSSMSMFRLSPLERLPSEMHQNIFMHLDGKDLATLSRTSSRMEMRVFGLSKGVPKSGLGEVEAFEEITQRLKGEKLGVLPFAVKSSPDHKAWFQKIMPTTSSEKAQAALDHIRTFKRMIEDRGMLSPIRESVIEGGMRGNNPAPVGHPQAVQPNHEARIVYEALGESERLFDELIVLTNKIRSSFLP
ncbi:RHS repeat-associated core domain-containing protein [Pseudomonas viridiflava]|uniref:RHS repeat-associated core domain-containing protein n=1 Tax=Pseudomonas viridiflava TaxID=33069 RepID=UPI000F05CF64|nr:RHS repeat-associated core domain-containing protein [Pseudomonas viridiflava]